MCVTPTSVPLPRTSTSTRPETTSSGNGLFVPEPIPRWRPNCEEVPVHLQPRRLTSGSSSPSLTTYSLSFTGNATTGITYTDGAGFSISDECSDGGFDSSIVSFSKGTFGNTGRAVSGCDYGTQCSACAQIRPYSSTGHEDVCKYDLDPDGVPDANLCHDGGVTSLVNEAEVDPLIDNYCSPGVSPQDVDLDRSFSARTSSTWSTSRPSPLLLQIR